MGGFSIIVFRVMSLGDDGNPAAIAISVPAAAGNTVTSPSFLLSVLVALHLAIASATSISQG